MPNALALWQQIALSSLAVCAICYALLFRVWRIRKRPPSAADLLFVLALVVASTAIAAPTPYHWLATRVIDASPLPAALDQADTKVAAIEALPRRLIDQALAKIGFDRDVETNAESDASAVEPSSTPDPADPTISAPESASRLAPAPPPGPFASAIRPSVESLVASILRLVGVGVSAFALMSAFAIRLVAATARRIRRVSHRLDALESALGNEAGLREQVPGQAAPDRG